MTQAMITHKASLQDVVAGDMVILKRNCEVVGQLVEVTAVTAARIITGNKRDGSDRRFARQDGHEFGGPSEVWKQAKVIAPLKVIAKGTTEVTALDAMLAAQNEEETLRQAAEAASAKRAAELRQAILDNIGNLDNISLHSLSKIAEAMGLKN